MVYIETGVETPDTRKIIEQMILQELIQYDHALKETRETLGRLKTGKLIVSTRNPVPRRTAPIHVPIRKENEENE